LSDPRDLERLMDAFGRLGAMQLRAVLQDATSDPFPTAYTERVRASGVVNKKNKPEGWLDRRPSSCRCRTTRTSSAGPTRSAPRPAVKRWRMVNRFRASHCSPAPGCQPLRHEDAGIELLGLLFRLIAQSANAQGFGRGVKFR
jgi:hypothetical protein